MMTKDELTLVWHQVLRLQGHVTINLVVLLRYYVKKYPALDHRKIEVIQINQGQWFGSLICSASSWQNLNPPLNHSIKTLLFEVTGDILSKMKPIKKSRQKKINLELKEKLKNLYVTTKKHRMHKQNIQSEK